MKQHVRFKNISEPSHAGLRDEVASLAERQLERHLADMQPDLVRLYAIIEKNRHHDVYRVALRLHVPSRILVAREDGYELRGVLQAAFDELERQLERHLEHLRRSHEWRGKERRAELRRLKATLKALPEVERKGFAVWAEPHLGSLTEFVRRELTYHRANGDLPPDEPTVLDIVDETLVRAANAPNQRTGARKPETVLRRITIETLADAIERARRERPDRLSLEARPPADAMALLSEDELFEFYQPDEVLRIEDLVPAPDAEPPEDIIEREETRSYVYRLLARLPVSWRRAWLLHHIDGREIGDVADILDVEPDQAEDWAAQATSFLAAHLDAAGYDITNRATMKFDERPSAATTTEITIAVKAAFAAATA